MMPHACEWCSSRQAYRVHRAAVFHLIRQNRNITNLGLTERLPVCRRSIVSWRKEGEERGCIPKRTKRATASEGGMRRPGSPPPGILALAYPIGTLWTDKATRRAA